MANFNSKRLQEIGILAIAVLLAQLALAKWVYPFFSTSLQQLYSITPQTALTSPTVGDKIMGFIIGLIPFSFGDVMSWVVVWLGAFVLLIAGYWAYEQRWAWKGRNIYQRLWAILLYGTAALYVVLLVTKMATVSTIALPLLIGLAINYFLVAFVITTAAKYFPVLRI
ncbi:MAG: hypothetical protein AAB875_04675 [Patescibacteria group bacterium]